MKMPIIAFDTLKFSKKLEASGLPSKQAEAFSEATSDAMSSFLEDHVATKSDILDLKKETKNLKVAIETIRKELKQYITKEDSKQFATKEDLKQFATKEDLKQFATKEDLKQFATKEDLNTTKQDLKNTESRLHDAINTMGLKITVRLGGIVTAGVIVATALAKL